MRILLVTALLIGCGAAAQQGPGSTPRSAAVPTNGSASASDDDDSQCREEAPTGSLIRHTFCRDKMERDGNRKEAEDWMERSRSSPSAVH